MKGLAQKFLFNYYDAMTVVQEVGSAVPPVLWNQEDSGLGFGVWGLDFGFWILSFGFRVQGLGSRI